jgi:hypothetical protein
VLKGVPIAKSTNDKVGLPRYLWPSFERGTACKRVQPVRVFHYDPHDPLALFGSSSVIEILDDEPNDVEMDPGTLAPEVVASYRFLVTGTKVDRASGFEAVREITKGVSCRRGFH